VTSWLDSTLILITYVFAFGMSVTVETLKGKIHNRTGHEGPEGV